MSGGVGKIPREYKPLIKAAQALGWGLDRTGKGHLRLRPPKGWQRPDGQPANAITMPATPGDHRAVKNCRGDLRRAGLGV